MLDPAKCNFQDLHIDATSVRYQGRTPLVDPLLRWIVRTYPDDPACKQLLRELSADPCASANSSGYSLRNGILYHEDAIHVPDCNEILLEICRQYHDEPTAGHPGIHCTSELISRQWHWQGMRQFVKRYVNHCQECSRNKNGSHKPYGLLQPLPIPETPWQSISLDFIVKLPVSEGYDSVLVVVNRLTKMAHFLPCNEASSTEEFAQLFFKSIFRLHGLPADIVSDRGSHFTSTFWKEVTRLCNVERKLSTSYHPETDGQTERTNQTLEQYLRIYCNYDQDNWASILHLAEFAYNNAQNTSTQVSPFFANYGYHPNVRILTDPQPPSQTTSGGALISRIHNVQEELQKELQYAQDTYKEFADRRRLSGPTLPIGSQVWLNARNISTTRPTKKLDYKRLGPFEVIENYKNRVFKLKLPHNLVKIHPWFHPSLLTPVPNNDIPGRRRAPPQKVVINDEDEYAIHQILDSRRVNKQLKYLVSWEGYGPESNTWEPHDRLKQDVPSLVAAFHAANPSKPQ